jgi:hypothetical protein
VVHDELELLQLHVNAHPKHAIPIVLVLSGQVLSGELVARRQYQAAVAVMPNAAQLVAIDGRSDGHVYMTLAGTQQVLKIDLCAVQGFGPSPAKPSGKPPGPKKSD